MTFQYMYYAVNTCIIYLCLFILIFYIVSIGVDYNVKRQKIWVKERKKRTRNMLIKKYKLDKVD